MNEIIKEELKAESEQYKIFSFFIIGLVTGVVSLLLRNNFYNDKIVLTLLIIGVAFLVGVVIMFVKSRYKIKRLITTLKK